MCFWAAGLSVFVQHFGREGMNRGVAGDPGTHHLRSGGELIITVLRSLLVSFWYLHHGRMHFCLQHWLALYSISFDFITTRQHVFVSCLLSPRLFVIFGFLAVGARAISTSI